MNFFKLFIKLLIISQMKIHLAVFQKHLFLVSFG